MLSEASVSMSVSAALDVFSRGMLESEAFTGDVFIIREIVKVCHKCISTCTGS